MKYVSTFLMALSLGLLSLGCGGDTTTAVDPDGPDPNAMPSTGAPAEGMDGDAEGTADEPKAGGEDAKPAEGGDKKEGGDAKPAEGGDKKAGGDEKPAEKPAKKPADKKEGGDKKKGGDKKEG